jgi:hypothetical protein
VVTNPEKQTTAVICTQSDENHTSHLLSFIDMSLGGESEDISLQVTSE